MKVLVTKAANPDRRRKVLTSHFGDEQEMRLWKWANRFAAKQAREAGNPASGPEWEAMREELFQSALADPQSQNLMAVDWPVPESEASSEPEPEVAGKSELEALMAQHPHLFDEAGNLALGEPMELAYDALLKMRGV